MNNRESEYSNNGEQDGDLAGDGPTYTQSTAAESGC